MMLKKSSRIAMLCLGAAILAGCSTTGSDTSGEPPVARGLSAGEIHNILAGKSWNFRGPNNTGTTLYAEDGSSLVEVDGKGRTRGRWETRDGQLCESFEASPPWLPGGVPMSCYPFARGDQPGTYQAGKAVFTPA
jgi:hypothetical protein